MGRNRRKTVRAGRLVYAICYTQATAADTPQERAAKSRVSSAARQRINFRHAWQKLELLLAANFEPDDLFVTLTYDNAHLPPDRDASRRRLGKFFRPLRTELRRRGEQLIYIYTTETMPDDPGGAGRLHHHMVLPKTCRVETIRALWPDGVVHIEPLLSGQFDSYEARARYLCKERHPGQVGRRTGLRAWTPSRGLQQPEVTSELVPDDVTITAPPGAYVLDRGGDQNTFGQYTYLKYLLPLPRRRL